MFDFFKTLIATAAGGVIAIAGNYFLQGRMLETEIQNLKLLSFE